MKRFASDDTKHSYKKHKPDHHSHHPRGEQKQYSGHPGPQAPLRLNGNAVNALPPPQTHSGPVPAYVPFTIAKGLPELPDVQPGPLSTAPFTHKSSTNYDRTTSSSDVTYERLEFLGDAYIELIASRLIYERYPNLTAGRQSQMRELLVKNETLAEYSRAYGFDTRVDARAMEYMLQDVTKKQGRGNKGFNKILGDVFEAYVAAVILSDVEDGFARAEKWLTALWAPKLVEATHDDPTSTSASSAITNNGFVDPRKVYNPTAKQELQKRIPGFMDVQLVYESYKETVELKGAQLGQNRHFIALYLTGFGYTRKVLGKGEGKNKVEAGNWAATEAMWGECRGVVEECEEKAKVRKEETRLRKEAEAEAKRSAQRGVVSGEKEASTA